ncbi:MAG: LuxR C-terminal-related transcriptional regulator [Armatimonadota bacterium]
MPNNELVIIEILAPRLIERALRSLLCGRVQIACARRLPSVTLLAGDAWERALERNPTDRGVVLLTEGSPTDMLSALRRDVRVLVSWEDTEAHLCRALAAAADRQSYFSPGLMGVSNPQPVVVEPEGGGSALPLSEREFEVVKLAVQGLSNDEISQSLHVTLATIKFHLKQSYRKLGISRRSQLAVRLTGTELLSPLASKTISKSRES